MIYKNTIKKIRKSLGRYLSLFIIVLVGVGVYSGLNSSAPDILLSVDKFYNEHKLMDYRIVSTLGLTDEDVKALHAIEHLDNIIPSYSLDVLSDGIGIRIHAIEAMNTSQLIAGRMPEATDEALADGTRYKIGDQIKISGDLDNKLIIHEFTVVGTIHSPMYMAYDYGSTTVGDGNLASYIYIDKANFSLDAYTEIYVTMHNPENSSAYTKEYDQLSRNVKNSILAIEKEREDARYQEIYHKANQEIQENEQKLYNEKETNEQKLIDAKSILDDSRLELELAKEDLRENELKLEEQVHTQENQFSFARNEIEKGYTEINVALQASGIEHNQLEENLLALENGIRMMEAQLIQLPVESQEYVALNQTLQEYKANYEGLMALNTSLQMLAAQESSLNEGIQTFEEEIEKARDEISKGKEEIGENEHKLEEGYREYNENLDKFNLEIAEAYEKIDDAKKELATLKTANWYVDDRDAVIGYSELKFGTDAIDSVAAVFPLFFILIVLLMTSNTMARMIVEERSELGTLTSIGYKDTTIIFTYLIYVLSATLLGSAVGFFIGSSAIPHIIYAAFSQFNLPPLMIQYDFISLGIISLVAVVLMTGVTIFFCYMELKHRPATLLRPIAPKAGQAIFLERIGFIWNRLSFTWKVTVRNIFRYKQRVIMTIVGVSGCAALLLTGFGLQDSINGVSERQFGEIFQYDGFAVLKDEVKTLEGELKTLLHKENITSPALIKQATFETSVGDTVLDTYLIVPEDIDQFEEYYHLSSIDSDELVLDDQGAIITQKLAEVLKLKVGDSIQLIDGDRQSYMIPVAAVAENYMKNYVYISKVSYKEIFDEEASYNMVIFNHQEEDSILAKYLLEDDAIVNVTFQKDIVQRAEEGNASLNDVVVLVVVIASLLAVIVLYNLTSINISERTREIATLKVLGFTDQESNQYIYREAFILSLISTGVGLLLGIQLHRFVIHVIEGDANVYFKLIHLRSYAFSAMIIIVISLLMQMITFFKMRTINMIESLKSVE